MANDINKMAAQSGRIVGEDGKTYNMVDLIQSSGGGNGASAYDIAVENGFVGTEVEWLASLKGDPGKDGTDGTNGTDGFGTEAQYNDIITRLDALETV